MAGISFNFGANAKPRKIKASKGRKKSSAKRSTSNNAKSNAWRAYVSNAPIPD